MNKQRRPLPPPPPVDNRTAVQKLIAADHEAGRHTLPLTKCPQCPPVPVDKIGRMGSVKLPAQEAATVVQPKPMTPSGAPYVSPKRVEKIKPIPALHAQQALAGMLKDEPRHEPYPVKPKTQREPFAGSHAVYIMDPNAGSRSVTREEWLLIAVEKMRPWLAEHDIIVPEVRISTGWPGGRGPKEGVRGQCWMATEVLDGKPAIFISPDQDDIETILGIVLHEMIHAAGGFGHKGIFAKAAKLVGFIPPFTSSENKTDELKQRIADLAAEMPPLDHSPIYTDRTRPKTIAGIALGTLLGKPISRPPVQTTRMILLRCPVDGYMVRTTRKWIEVGLPVCPAPMNSKAGDWYDDLDNHKMQEVTK